MNILFLGDSLIEFFDWQERFPNHKVANLGMAGESVGGLLSRVLKVQKIFPEADSVFIMSGINNVAMEDLEFFDFYRDIVEKLSSFYPDARIFIQSLLPTAVDFIPDDSIKRVNDSLKKLTENAGKEYLDIYSRFVDAEGRPIRKYLLDDGVHLSGTGYDAWSGAIEEIINPQEKAG